MPTPTPTPTPTPVPTPTWFETREVLTYVENGALDALLQRVMTADLAVMCEGLPTTAYRALTPKSNGGARLGAAPAVFSGPAADGQGRALTLEAVEGEEVEETGIWDCVALVDTSAGVLRATVPKDHAPLVSTDAGTNSVTMSGDYTSDLMSGDDVTLRLAGSNDNWYVVDEVSVNVNGTDTDLTFTDANAVAETTYGEGFIIWGALKLTSGHRVYSAPFDITSTVPLATEG